MRVTTRTQLPLHILLVGACLVCAAQADADTITTADGNGADSYVQSTLGGNNAANANFGSSGGVLIKHDTGLPGNNRMGYMRFDISSVTDPIVGVSLDLSFLSFNANAGANPSTYNIYGLVDGHAGEAWGELAITWNNAPGNNTGSAAGVTAGATFLDASDLFFPASVGTVLSFSSSAMLNFVQNDTDGLVTFIMTRRQRNFRTEAFASKESVSPAPTLNITTQSADPIPEPGTFVLFGVAAYVVRRRSKAS